ncbi:glutathione-regulated potassium-efflux system protein KefC [Magnetovirga frankeli]|uniref:glutathione-regulated potassium-efflux system protein KefC n=1 Tax=Magnetovirga frankeli TaxID=947516 RepID=UPI001292FA34|nr:glutathione-regulated potassium-efflux system protein KefC [gamma proteobacterium SS-5]
MAETSLLGNTVIYLTAAVIAVPLAKRLGLGSVLGYLIAGAIIGPWVLGLIHNVEDILHFAEFGVVLLLFLIGLELNPRRLWSMRRPILGLGGLQVVASSALLMIPGLLLGLELRVALVIAMGLSLSSTAIALQTLQERNLLPTRAGRSAFSVLLFQDIAVIPMLALIPLLGSGVQAESGGLMGLLKVAGAIAGVVVLGHYLTRPIFRFIAKTGLQEIFTAFTLLLVTGIALLMAQVQLSMALGSFLAGVLLAESEYRHVLEAEIKPFKGLLLGLFFISVGMSINFGLLLAQPLLILGLVLLLIGIKLLVLWIIAGRTDPPLEKDQRALFAFLLCQGGEFAFVLFGVARTEGLLSTALVDPLILGVSLSMAITPLLLLLLERFIQPQHIHLGEPRPADQVEEFNPVIIAGFGRFGRIVGRLLYSSHIPTTVLDHDPDHIEAVRKFGYKVYYGDATRLDILRAAGAEQARLLIIALDDPEASVHLVQLAREHFPQLKILARARDLSHAYQLEKQGADLFQREMLESALRLGEQGLRYLGLGAYHAHEAVNRFRDYDRSLYDLLREEGALELGISIQHQGRDELEQVLNADRAEFPHQRDPGWE